MFASSTKLRLPTPDEALPGRSEAMRVAAKHLVLDAPLTPPFPPGTEHLLVGMGCFWGAERLFWKLAGVHTTAVGYAAGLTRNPSYREVCTGRTGHNEVVLVVYDPRTLPLEALLRALWEGHDPTQGMRQGNDVGTQYRSGLYLHSPEQRALAEASRDAYQARLSAAGLGPITTEILPQPTLYYAEDDHQQYLAKNPGGYCGLGGTGVSCAVGALVSR